MHNTKPVVLLDDGEYYIEHNINYSIEQGNGFLLRRCTASLTTPGGYECIGGYERTAAGKWRASIDAPYSAERETDCEDIGAFDARLDAITALWKRRQDAYCRHK